MLLKWSHGERRAEGETPSTNNKPNPRRLRTRVGSQLLRISPICSCLPPFRSWINMRRTVQRAAQCCQPTSPIPASLSEQCGRQAAARTACQGCFSWLRVRSAISQSGLTEGSRGPIGPSNMFTLVIKCMSVSDSFHRGQQIVHNSNVFKSFAFIQHVITFSIFDLGDSI